jgi:hypothetical protein
VAKQFRYRRRVALRSRARPAGIAIVLILCAASTARPQSSRSAATLEGTVVDSTGDAVPGATVEAVEGSTGVTRTATTGADGRWRIPEIPVGTYRVRVSLAGFTPWNADAVRLQLGQVVRLEATLAPEGVTAEVTVSGGSPALDPTRTAQTLTVENERILELPTRARNYLEFVMLAPGVTPSPRRGTAGSGTPLADSGFSFAGLRPRSNALTIDGVDNTEEYTGAGRTALSLEIVREFQIVNSGLSAEAGGSSGGAINVITKTGTNAVHGDAFVLGRLEPLSARRSAEAADADATSRRWRAGFALNGPIARNRTFFALAVEQEHTREPSSARVPAETRREVDPILAARAISGLAITRTSAAPAGLEETEASGKLNHQLTSRHALMLRYAFVNERRTGDAFGADALSDGTARGTSFTRDHGVVGSLVTTGARAVSDLRLQAAWRNVRLRTGDTAGPGIVIPGVFRLGRPWEGNADRTETRLQAAETVTLARGAHVVKAGATVNHVRLRADTPDGVRGLYTFLSLDDLASARPDSYRQAFGPTVTRLNVTTYGAFIHDRWSAGRANVDAGIRYDFERLPSPVPEDWNNLSPRLGLAVTLDRSSVLRASLGRYHDRYILAALERPFRLDGRLSFEQVIDAPEAALVLAQTGGRPLADAWPGIGPSRYEIGASLRTPASDQASLSFERLLAADLTGSVTYLFARGLNQQRTRNANLVREGARLLPVEGPWRDVFRLEDSARSRYDGLSLLLNRRFAHEVAFTVAYTLSRAKDDASDYDEQPADPTNLGAEWSLSRQHQAHRLVINGLFDVFEVEPDPKTGRKPPVRLWQQFLGQWELAPTITLGSGRPANLVSAFDLYRAHALPPASRPAGAPRNPLRTPGTFNVDLRVVKYLSIGKQGKLDLVLDFFNLFNRANVLAINPVAGREGRPILWSSPREVQFSVDFEF